MSKLFDTLEQIRRHEASNSPGGVATKAAGRRIRPALRGYFLLLALVAALALAYLNWPWLNVRRLQPVVPKPLAASDSRTESAAGPATPVQAPAGAVKSGQDPVVLNNLAVQQIENHDHWHGIYNLAVVLEQTPDAVEPLINMGVALAELGLFEPAKYYLGRALLLEPGQPALRKNISILKHLGIIDEAFSRSVLEGRGKAGVNIADREMDQHQQDNPRPSAGQQL